jgi:hypothetical protein
MSTNTRTINLLKPAVSGSNTIYNVVKEFKSFVDYSMYPDYENWDNQDSLLNKLDPKSRNIKKVARFMSQEF